ncbi:MAG TPA: adenylate kinase [Acetobacteraceae bacterium]|jgi:adenylate kinase family enzyme
MCLRTRRIHVFGASGAGVTTLGRALADALGIPHHDTDDYFWLPTAPPYLRTRDVADRLRLMREMFLERSDWVLSGSLDDWGRPVHAMFDLVAFLYVPTEIRVHRLRARETRRFGRDAVSPGGWRHQEASDFIDWASHYDDATREGRNLPRHQAWLSTLPCPVLRLDGTLAVADLVDQVVRSLPT